MCDLKGGVASVKWNVCVSYRRQINSLGGDASYCSSHFSSETEDKEIN